MTTLDTAVGSLAKARDNLRNALAASSAFQAWVGAADAAEALERIHLSALPLPPPQKGEYTEAELASVLPCAIVHTVAFSAIHDATGSAWEYTHGGSINVHFIGPADSETAAYPGPCGRKFENVLGGILDDLEAIAGTSAGFAFSSAMMREEPERGHFEDLPTKADLFRADVLFTW
jgi:hypothetical protein